MQKVMKSRWELRAFLGLTVIALLGLFEPAIAVAGEQSSTNSARPEEAPGHLGPQSHPLSLVLALLAGGGALALAERCRRSHRSSQQTQQALQQAEARYRDLIDQAVVGIFQTTPQGQFLCANPALAQLLGYSSVISLQATLTDLDHQLYVLSGRRREFVALMQEYGAINKFESQVYRSDGQILWIAETAQVVTDAQGKALYYEGFVTDITAQKRVEAQLLHDSLHDSLTGLPNRTFLMQRLASALHQAAQTQTQQFAVIFVNLDCFHRVNEALGRSMGDQVLIEVSRRLHHCLRSQDTCARLGDDKFVILIEDVRDDYSIRHIVDRIQQEFKAGFILGGQTLGLSARVGSILSSPSYQKPDEVLRDAEAALGRSKQGQASQLMSSPASLASLNLVADLKRAVENHEFQLHYQPIVKMRHGQVQGFEALVRWQHPRQGLIPAREFMTMAEENGLMVPLGWWVLREACHQLKTWQVRFAMSYGLTVSVNLSAPQFFQLDLVQQIQQIVQELELNAGSLKLEVTEKTLMTNPDLAAKQLWDLQELGIQVAIDDFGTGFSSLSHLHNLPIQTLKIDRSFVTGVEHEPEKLEMIRTIVTLAWNLGMDVVAEGVETQKQRSQLIALNCDVGQGHLFSKPLNSDAAAVLLTEIDGARGVF